MRITKHIVLFIPLIGALLALSTGGCILHTAQPDTSPAESGPSSASPLPQRGSKSLAPAPTEVPPSPSPLPTEPAEPAEDYEETENPQAMPPITSTTGIMYSGTGDMEIPLPQPSTCTTAIFTCRGEGEVTLWGYTENYGNPTILLDTQGPCTETINISSTTRTLEVYAPQDCNYTCHPLPSEQYSPNSQGDNLP